MDQSKVTDSVRRSDTFLDLNRFDALIQGILTPNFCCWCLHIYADTWDQVIPRDFHPTDSAGAKMCWLHSQCRSLSLQQSWQKPTNVLWKVLTANETMDRQSNNLLDHHRNFQRPSVGICTSSCPASWCSQQKSRKWKRYAEVETLWLCVSLSTGWQNIFTWSYN